MWGRGQKRDPSSLLGSIRETSSRAKRDRSQGAKEGSSVPEAPFPSQPQHVALLLSGAPSQTGLRPPVQSKRPQKPPRRGLTGQRSPGLGVRAGGRTLTSEAATAPAGAAGPAWRRSLPLLRVPGLESRPPRRCSPLTAGAPSPCPPACLLACLLTPRPPWSPATSAPWRASQAGQGTAARLRDKDEPRVRWTGASSGLGEAKDRHCAPVGGLATQAPHGPPKTLCRDKQHTTYT